VFWSESEQTYAGIGRVLVFLYFLFVFVKKYRSTTLKVNIYLTAFLFFTFILVFSSSDLITSATRYFKVLMILSGFPFAYLYFKENSVSMEKVVRILVLMLILFSSYIILSNYFDLGSGVYEEYNVSFRSGALIADSLYTGSLLVLLLPFIYFYEKKQYVKNIYFVFSLLTIILILLSLRRTAFLILIIGILIYMFFQRGKLKSIMFTLIVVTALYVFSPLFSSIFESRLQSRERITMVENYENEGRYIETFLVWERILSFSSLRDSFFGIDVYNTAYKYGFNNPRELHVDINQIIFGTGLIGLLMYLLIYISMIKQISKINSKDYERNLLKTTITMFIIITILVSFIGGFFSITYRFFAFFIIGACLGYYDRNYNFKLVAKK
jgi:O-antigen ligase